MNREDEFFIINIVGLISGIVALLVCDFEIRLMATIIANVFLITETMDYLMFNERVLLLEGEKIQ